MELVRRATAPMRATDLHGGLVCPSLLHGIEPDVIIRDLRVARMRAVNNELSSLRKDLTVILFNWNLRPVLEKPLLRTAIWAVTTDVFTSPSDPMPKLLITWKFTSRRGSPGQFKFSRARGERKLTRMTGGRGWSKMPPTFADTEAARWAAAKAASYEPTCAAESSLPHVRAVADKTSQENAAIYVVNMVAREKKRPIVRRGDG